MAVCEPLTVRLDALAANYRLLQAKAGQVAAVVKADAYGLGADAIAPALLKAGCQTFFVARLEEGVALRKLLPTSRIFVLDGALAHTVSALAVHNLIPVLSTLDQIALWAKVQGGDAALHFDTGMNRLGLTIDELSLLAAERKTRLAKINPVLLMSHLACADEPENPLNAVQLSRFRAGLAMLPPAPASLAASSGVFLGRDYLFDLARTGIALYGGNPQPASKNPMQPVAFLSAPVLQTRQIAKGQGVGYGATFIAKRPTRLATVALGYADGISRALSNRGVAHIAGKTVPMVGRVSMDLITLDVTHAGPVQPGDPCEFLGNHIKVDDVAAAAGTNAYEVLTALACRLARRYTDQA